MDGPSRTHPALAYFPQVLVATTLVAVVPAAVVWGLRADGIIAAAWICLGLAVVLSLIASFAGSAYWVRSRRMNDVLFSDLLVWGWLRRLYVEHQIARVIAALGQSGSSGPGESDEQRVRFLKQLANALDDQDPYLNGHSRRVARYATGTAHRMGLFGEQATAVQTAAAIHDVGKLHTPSEILRKPGRLTDAEFAIMRRHADEGAAMVACLGDPGLTATVRHHHERFDGTGYPSGLKGAEIPLGARIIAVADTFDAITSLRPYRSGAPHKKALDVLRQEAGTQLDPAPVRAFIAYYAGRRGSVMWSLATSPQNAFARTVRSGMPAALMAMIVGAAAVAAVPLGVADRHGRRPLVAAVTATTTGVTGNIARATKALVFHEGSARLRPSQGAVRNHAGKGSVRTRALQIPNASAGYSVPVIAAVARSIGIPSTGTPKLVFSGSVASRAPASGSPAMQTLPPRTTLPGTPPPTTAPRAPARSPHPKSPTPTQLPRTQPPSTQPEPAPTNPKPRSRTPPKTAPSSSTPPGTTPPATTPPVALPPTSTPPPAPPTQPEPPAPPIPPTPPPDSSGNQGQGDQGQGNGGVAGQGQGNQGQGDQGQGNGGVAGQGQGNQGNAT